MISGAVPLLYANDHILHAPLTEFEQGQLVGYRETPERVEVIHRHLLASGLGIPVRAGNPASIDDLFAVHDLTMLDFLEAVSHVVQPNDLYIYPELFPIRAGMNARPKHIAGRLGLYSTDIYAPVGRGTWRALLSAAGLALRGADLLLRREASSAYALTRPPGHHAGPDFFGSYCYVNHAALAARRLLSAGRVAVLDIDYHHGNGTQAVFWNEPRVLYASLHIDPNYDFPYFNGYANETGGSQAPGSTMNIPLPPETGAPAYLAALDALISAIRAFGPSALVVSLGYDPFEGDPLSAFRLDSDVYGAMGRRIAALGVPALFVQEGGYALDALPQLAENFIGGYLAGALEK